MKRPLTPVDLVRRAFKLYPQRVAVLEEGGVRLTYAQLAERTYRLGHALQDAGLGVGDHIAVLSPNTHVGMLAYLAVPWLQGVLVPMNTRLQPDEYRFQLDFADVRLLLCDPSLLDKVGDVCAELGIPVWVHDDTLEARLAAASAEPLPFPLGLDEDSPITINFTSGTTSSPKGVMLTHRNTYLNALEVVSYLRAEQDSVYLHTLPMFHANGWGGTWAFCGAGATHVTLPAVRADKIYAAIEEHGVTHLCAAPTVLSMLTDPQAARTVPRPVRVVTAGSPPHAALIAAMSGLGFEVTQVYGLTETSPLITIAELTGEQRALPIEQQAPLIAKQGFEMLGTGEVVVMTQEMLPVPHDGETLGEIMVQSNLVMLGYYKNEAATQEALAGGYFHTGDVAVTHPDGRIEIRDRNKDVIISGGENISSVEVEGVLYRHPAVREAVVVAMPHAKWGEVPCAFIALHAGRSATHEELTVHVRALLAGYKVPKDYRFLDDLPKTASGKFQKFLLRQELWLGQERGVN